MESPPLPVLRRCWALAGGPALALIAFLLGVGAMLPLVWLAVADDGGPTTYSAQVAELSAEAAPQLSAAAPASVLATCLNGDTAACARQETNAAVAADRVGVLRADLAALTPSPQAQVWHQDYLAVLAALEAALRAQSGALAVRDLERFRAAVEATRSAVAEEQALTDRFNRRLGVAP